MIKVHVIDPPRNFNPRNLETDLKRLLGRDLSVQVVVENPPQFRKIPEPWVRHQIGFDGHGIPDGILAATRETAARLPEGAFGYATVALIDDRGRILGLDLRLNARPVSRFDDEPRNSGDASRNGALRVAVIAPPKGFSPNETLVPSLRELLGQPHLPVEVVPALPPPEATPYLNQTWFAREADRLGTRIFACPRRFFRECAPELPERASVFALDEDGNLDGTSLADAAFWPWDTAGGRRSRGKLVEQINDAVRELADRG